MAARTPHPKPEHAQRQALEPLPPPQKESRPRAHLRIERRACRLLDADNFAGGCKALIDCLRTAELIQDDDLQSLETTFIQTRVTTKAEEGTALEIKIKGTPQA